MAVTLRTVPLHHVAHSRTGDKGGTVNVSVIAYRPEDFRYLVNQLTVERIQQVFQHRAPSSVKRYVLPQLHAMNFVLQDTLDGGVNASLNLDSHGKTLSFLLLRTQVQVPE